MAFPSPPSSHPGSSDSLTTGGPDRPGFPTEQWPEWQAVPRDSPGLYAGSLPSPGVSGSGLERDTSPSSPHRPHLQGAHVRARGQQKSLTPGRPHPLTTPRSGCTPWPHSGKAHWVKGLRSLADTSTPSLKAPGSCARCPRFHPPDTLLLHPTVFVVSDGINPIWGFPVKWGASRPPQTRGPGARRGSPVFLCWAECTLRDKHGLLIPPPLGTQDSARQKEEKREKTGGVGARKGLSQTEPTGFLRQAGGCLACGSLPRTFPLGTQKTGSSVRSGERSGQAGRTPWVTLGMPLSSGP